MSTADCRRCHRRWRRLIERKAQKELDRLIPILAKQQGVTEQLKAENQLKWVGLMNNVKAQVEEKIYTEIVYVR